MHTQKRISAWVPGAIAALLLIAGQGAALATAQTAPVAKGQPAADTPISDQELSATQDQLMKLLRMSPTLTSVVATDPSLLADQEYVGRSNPELEQFLVSHPDVARNPEFYLFSNLNSENGHRDEALKRAIWPEISQAPNNNSVARQIADDVTPILGFACFLVALVWLTRLFLENRRWSRIVNLQSEVHGKLIEKFSSTQELAAYMSTEAGKRYLEAAPIPLQMEPEQRVPNAVARVLTPLQIGVVLVLLGCGLLFLRNAGPEYTIPMLVLGTVVLMPGIGFILSAGVTWVLAGRLGLIPENPSGENGPSNPRNGQ